MNLFQFFQCLRDSARLNTSKNSLLYRYTYGLKPRNRRLSVNRHTEFVIDGFPRSGNTYSACIVECLTSNASFSHHQHNFSNIVDAIHYNIPILLLYRSPADIVPSLLLRNPYTVPNRIIRSWIYYYSTILDYKYDRLLTLSFDCLIANPQEYLNQFFVNSSLKPRLPVFDSHINNLIREKQVACNMNAESGNILRAPYPSQQKDIEKKRYKYQMSTKDTEETARISKSLYNLHVRL